MHYRPAAIVSSITALAVALSEGRTSDELNALGNSFLQLGDTLVNIAAQRDLAQARKTSDTSVMAQPPGQ